MATNFLIALATALGSATVMLLVLRVALKIWAPNAFNEMIPVPKQAGPAKPEETQIPSLETLLSTDVLLENYQGVRFAPNAFHVKEYGLVEALPKSTLDDLILTNYWTPDTMLKPVGQHPVVIDDVTLSALTKKQIADLVQTQKQKHFQLYVMTAFVELLKKTPKKRGLAESVLTPSGQATEDVGLLVGRT